MVQTNLRVTNSSVLYHYREITTGKCINDLFLYFNTDAVGSVKYLFIIITPRSTVTWRSWYQVGFQSIGQIDLFKN